MSQATEFHVMLKQFENAIKSVMLCSYHKSCMELRYKNKAALMISSGVKGVNTIDEAQCAWLCHANDS